LKSCEAPEPGAYFYFEATKASSAELAIKLLEASSTGDEAALRALCDPGLEVRQNGGPNLGFDALLGLANSVRRVAPDFRYENAIRVATDDGWVEEHDACGTVPDGTAFRIPACVVATVKNGRIASLHEYLDSAAARPLIRALSSRSEGPP
jgi:ketosteroid isomerase-like protein